VEPEIIPKVQLLPTIFTRSKGGQYWNFLVFLKLLGHCWRRCHQGVDRPKLKIHKRAILFGQVCQLYVWRLPQNQQIAHNGP